MIYLIGMPGVGKSYWAHLLGNALAITTIDLDEYIVSHTGKDIPTLFAISETHFRKEEAAALRKLTNKPQIIACGGGTPCFEDNIGWMLKNGLVIWLDDDLKNIETRIIQDSSVRPILKDGAVYTKLERLYQARIPFYERATYRIVVNQPNSVKFVTEIIKNYYKI